MWLSKHAAQRWVERFPHLCVYEQMEAARPATNRVRNIVRSHMRTPREMRSPKLDRASSYQFRVTDEVVFVMGDNESVITVFAMPVDKFRWRGG